MAGSNWDKILGLLIETLKDELPRIKNQDYVEFCLKNEQTREVVEDYLRNCTLRKKCNLKSKSLSERKKDEGNVKYKNRKYEESLSLYTESIFYANKNDECLPLAYSNRSLVLQQLGHISECLQDIDIALESGYPKDKSGKLILRKAKCLVQSGEVDKAKKVLTEALNENKTGDSQAIEKELKTIKNLKSKQTPKSSGYKLPQCAGGENDDFVSASKHLNVFYNQTKGRHVIATHDFEAGDVLFVEKPFAFVIFKNFCHGCCKRLIAPIPCWTCLDVSYCSPKCRDEFWQSVHSFECGYSELFQSVGIAHLSLRIVLAASSNFEELKKTQTNMKESKYIDGIIPYKNSDYESVYNLVHNSEKYDPNDLFQYVMTAILLAQYMKNYTNYFPKKSGEEDLRLFSSIIWRHIMQLICNGHAIVDTFLEGQNNAVFSETEQRIGTGIYPSASMMNHSCEPSVVYSFHNSYLIVRAAKEIKKGEEVFNCYGPHARRMKRRLRQEILSKQYFFKCECRPCCERYDIQDIYTASKCSNCKGASVPKEENSQELICLNCGCISQITAEISQKQMLCDSLIEEGEILLDDDPNLALKKFLDGWLLGREIYYKFHKDLSSAADKVAMCLAVMQDFRRCVLFLKCSVLSVEKRFGSSSIEAANEMKKLGDALTRYAVESEGNAKRETAREGVLFYQKAKKIITLLYGPQHQDIEEIQKNIGILEAMLKKQ